jgi:hypothetical protein
MGKFADKLASNSAESQRLCLGQFPEIMLKVGNLQIYYQTLTDFDFISLKIQASEFGVERLIKDYDLIDDPEILEKLEADQQLEAKQVKTLKLIQNALQFYW